MSRNAQMNTEITCTLCDTSFSSADPTNCFCKPCVAVLNKSSQLANDPAHTDSHEWQKNYGKFLSDMQDNPVISATLKQCARTTRTTPISLIDFLRAFQKASQKSSDHVILATPADGYRKGDDTLQCIAAARLMRTAPTMSGNGAWRIFDALQKYLINQKVVQTSPSHFILINAYISRLYQAGYYEEAILTFNQYYGNTKRFLNNQDQFDFHGLNREAALLATISILFQYEQCSSLVFVVGQHGIGAVRKGVEDALKFFSSISSSSQTGSDAVICCQLNTAHRDSIIALQAMLIDQEAHAHLETSKNTASLTVEQEAIDQRKITHRYQTALAQQVMQASRTSSAGYSARHTREYNVFLLALNDIRMQNLYLLHLQTTNTIADDEQLVRQAIVDQFIKEGDTKKATAQNELQRIQRLNFFDVAAASRNTLFQTLKQQFSKTMMQEEARNAVIIAEIKQRDVLTATEALYQRQFSMEHAEITQRNITLVEQQEMILRNYSDWMLTLNNTIIKIMLADDVATKNILVFGKKAQISLEELATLQNPSKFNCLLKTTLNGLRTRLANPRSYFLDTVIFFLVAIILFYKLHLLLYGKCGKDQPICCQKKIF